MLLAAILYLIMECMAAAKGAEDQVAEAITVYRNPEFFRPLSKEFNNSPREFNSEPPKTYSDREQYRHSDPSGYSRYDKDNENYEHHAPFESERQHSRPDDEEEHIEDYPESEGGGFNSYEGTDSQFNSPVSSEHHEGHDIHLDEPTMFKFPISDEEEYRHHDYKYPGEPKKPNPPHDIGINVHFDRNPDFYSPPRDVPREPGPKKKGRGPYGHPRQNQPPPRYNQEFEEERRKPEQLQLKEIEQKNRKYNEDDYQVRRPQEELQIYHDGQSYPVEFDDYREADHSPVMSTYHPDDYYDSEHRPYATIQNPQHYHHEAYPPAVQSENHLELVDELKDPKKGTREYLRQRKPPYHHHHHHHPHHHHHHPYIHHHNADLHHHHGHPRPHVSCSTKIRHKKPKKLVAYSVRPLYSSFKVVPVAFKVKPLYLSPVSKKYIPIFKRSSKIKSPRPLHDDSAYVINSEKDDEHEKLKHLKRAHNG